ncbi:MAG: FAD-dependent oxidoreductase [Caulobacteraceae bacterium]|nr:FAD-dependent oxidoreductase [Caulobacteraceae bacterium]
MAERILVIGAGMAGLCLALALAPTGREIVLVERDAAPPQESADQAFFDWNRRGVGHLRHSHAFLARLRNLIKDNHPALLARLLEAGCREIGFADMLPERLKAEYRPSPGDADMAVLTSRRTTLEWVIRDYAETLANVSIVNSAIVRSLVIEVVEEGQLRVVGLKGEVAGEPAEWRADAVIDAGGKNSQAIEQLIEAGAVIGEECEDCGILYYTRHYRLLPGLDEPPRNKAPGTGDLGFIKYGLFPGDNRCFSVTLAVPEIEMALRQNVVRPEVFDRICAMFPGIAPWTDAARAEPISKVFGMGDLKSRWRSLVAADQRATLGFFAVGDSLIRTNPLYGRGCSFAAIEAYILRDVLEETADPAARARLYDARVKAELTPYFDDMRSQDRASVRRAKNVQDPAYVAPLRARVMTSFLNDGIRIALRSDVALMRAALRDFHMIEPPGVWLKRPGNLAKVLGVWAKGRRRNADLYPPSPGPGRGEMMRGLGLGAEPVAG